MVSTPDPSQKKAPYQKDSVQVDGRPKGWKGGHDKIGIFASFKGEQTIAAGDDVTVPATSAGYTSKGSNGTVIKCKPGVVTFHVSSPVEGDVVCTPENARTFAKVTE